MSLSERKLGQDRPSCEGRGLELWSYGRLLASSGKVGLQAAIIYSSANKDMHPTSMKRFEVDQWLD